MGSPKQLRKQYEKPKKLFDKDRIEREAKLREEYGLKNAREVWKADTELRKIRREARRLLSRKGKKIEERTKKLIDRIKRFLVRKPEVTLDDILVLEVRDLLERRLQTIVYKKHMAKTVTQARQFITHGHVSIGGEKVSVPSYRVRLDEEAEIAWHGAPIEYDKPAEAKAKAAPAKEEAPAAEAAPEKTEAAPAAATGGSQ